MGDTQQLLTATEASERTGITQADLHAACRAGLIPGAYLTNGHRGAWAIPADGLAAYTATALPAGGADRAVTPTEPQGGGVVPDTTASVRQLVDAARRVELAQAHTSTRGARAIPPLVWRHVETAARHTQDRDGSCRHDGWPWPCPDYTDAADAVTDAVRVLLDGAS